MRQFTAALFSRVFGPVIALFSEPCGRCSTFGRRRRSTRVRRYVHALHAPSLPSLALPSQTIEAEGVALVGPYFAAHERLCVASPA